jgi:hypothetical protein
LTVSATAIQELIELGREEMPDAPGLSEFRAIAPPPEAAVEDNPDGSVGPAEDNPDDLVGQGQASASEEQSHRWLRNRLPALIPTKPALGMLSFEYLYRGIFFVYLSKLL